MPRNPAESNKAIVLAWENEQQLVQEGKGTRDWTQEQQRAILERGKAYDDDGKAFVGQHMRSAAAYPESQGDPNNIQFLTHDEHFEAHDRNWQNPTNWYYNPVTKEKTDFGTGPIIPCTVIKLSLPIIELQSQNNAQVVNDELNPERIDANKSSGTDPPINESAVEETDTEGLKATTNAVHINGFLEDVKKTAKRVGLFVVEHKVEIGLGLLTFISTAVKMAIDSDGNGSDKDNSNDGNTNNIYDSCPLSSDSSLSDGDESDDGISINRNYPDGRNSPCEHDVSGYTRHWNGKEIHVDPYKRGGHNSDD